MHDTFRARGRAAAAPRDDEYYLRNLNPAFS